jgi:hypothetical protein
MDHHEHAVSALLDRATADLATDPHRVVAGGMARGRALRRRRRAGTAVAAVVVLGVIGAGAAAVPQPRGGEPTVGVAAEPTASPSEQAEPASRRFGTDPAKTAAVLEQLLPEGEVRDRKAWSSDEPGKYQGGSLVWNGGLVSMLLEREDDRGAPRGPQERCLDSGGYVECAGLPNGDWYTTRTLEEPAAGVEHTGIWSTAVSLFTVDGFTLTATAYNGPGEKHVRPTAAEPVLDGPQLERIVRDPVWLEDPQ